ncbi:putative quinol monooxygenase [Paenibacillus wynnii]|uniref:putative quinol monooxygenase n=1 Tax=Paenibacillus wynnii TaxID=268407 RepID=UPI00278FE797|nr:putative quinol monooxygenase [Paenibacillus wynnii]MDQ0195177.1 quinol monooxygenase YgiN [Paenibacillus wynnii]
MIIIHAVFHVLPERQAQFLEEIKPLIAASVAEEGNQSYELYRHTEHENDFIMVETWRDSEAVSEHNASAHFTAFAAKAGTFLAAPLDVKVYSGNLV